MTITIVTDTNSIDKKSVYVWALRQCFDGVLQQLMRTDFWVSQNNVYQESSWQEKEINYL